MRLLLETAADLDAAAPGTTGRDSAGYPVGKDDDGWFVAHNGKRLHDIADFLPVVLDSPVADAQAASRFSREPLEHVARSLGAAGVLADNAQADRAATIAVVAYLAAGGAVEGRIAQEVSRKAAYLRGAAARRKTLASQGFPDSHDHLLVSEVYTGIATDLTAILAGTEYVGHDEPLPDDAVPAHVIPRNRLKLVEGHVTRQLFAGADDDTRRLVHQVAFQVLKHLNIPVEGA